jgi:hypothetical protein
MRDCGMPMFSLRYSQLALSYEYDNEFIQSAEFLSHLATIIYSERALSYSLQFSRWYILSVLQNIVSATSKGSQLVLRT